MSLTAIRAALRPRAAVIRRTLLTVLGVIAIVAGLVAMHAPSADAPHSAPAAALPSTAHHAGDSTGTASEPATHERATDSCGTSACDSVHVMTLMACILAVLLVTLTFGAAPTSFRWPGPLRSAGHAMRVAVRAAPVPPPSLVALSISRT